ncbi:MAG: hypothetical protein KatS3mg102_0857 [Planctomycetota bacterium]|nr:MAG: hypothetical protein KatS3mg102_0857 [Planctomycetota bacterium]
MRGHAVRGRSGGRLAIGAALAALLGCTAGNPSVQTTAAAPPPEPAASAGSAAAQPVPGGPGMRISGPYRHANLSLYLIHGAQTLGGERWLTLEEALAQGVLVVHETGEVNRLAVENRSADAQVFIQAGEIVRGGKQDRVLAVDMVVGPSSGKLPIEAFCVESGRWRQRGGESAAYFGTAKNQIAGNALKKAMLLRREQEQVWQQVAAVQEALARSLGREVRSAASATSLDLTLDNEAVAAAVQAYTDALGELVGSSEDAIGYAYAVNGRIAGADVYGSRVLLHKLWPKLLRACAVEAVAERAGAAEGVSAPSAAAVADWLAAAQTGQLAAERELPGGVRVRTREADANLQIETRLADGAEREAWLRRCYLPK